MKALDTFDRLTVGLIAACLLLALIVAVELLFPATVGEFETVTTGDDAAEMPTFSDAVFVPPSMDELGEMLGRPLFFQDRKLPPPPQAAVATAPPPTPLRLALEGVAITAESRIAVLRNLENNGLLQLEEGMSHMGWTLDEVTASGARFSRGAQVAELPLDPGANTRRRR